MNNSQGNMGHSTLLITILTAMILGAFCIALAEKTRIPSIIYYFIFGILFGNQALGLINTDSLGSGLSIIINIFVCVILFEGGLSLNVSKLKQINRSLLRHILLTIAVVFPAAFASARYIANLSSELSLIFASLAIVTGPTVIKPVLWHIPLRNRVKTFLNGESIIIDALGAVLTIAALDYILSAQHVQNTVFRFLSSIMIGIATGAIFGLIIKYILVKTNFVRDSIKSVFIFGTVFLNFLIAELIATESGLMSVAIYGIVLSTLDYKSKEPLLFFKEQITRIIISILFILLSSNFNFELLLSMLPAGIMIVIILVLTRFPVVYISTIGGDFTRPERLFIGWVGPRGIIALSIASIAGIKLKGAGFLDAEKIELLIFILISVTVLLQGLSSKIATKFLKITVHGDRNILLLGVNNLSLIIANEWRAHGHDVMFIDSIKKNSVVAEKNGFKCVSGNGLDSQVYKNFEIESFNSAFATTANYEINVLFCMFVKETFGISNVYCLQSESSSEELNEMIRDYKIKTINIAGLIHKKKNFIGSIISFFQTRNLYPHSIRVTDANTFTKNYSNSLQGEGYHLLCLIRGDDCHIFTDDLKFNNNDVLVFVSENSAGISL